MRRLPAFFAVVLIAAPHAAAAQPAASAPAAASGQAAAAASATTAAPAKEKPICKTQEEPGSRLGGKRICRTKAEWNEFSAQQRQEIERRLTLGPARPSN